MAVIDYGMGNLHSVAKALEFIAARDGLRVQVDVTADPEIIGAADRVIFPGVGAIRDCMAAIRRLNVDAIVEDAARSKPVLAICVGMQTLLEFSEENNGVECLGLVKGQVQYFGENHLDTQGNRLKVPHMGWNCVRQTTSHPLWKDIPDDSRFYFVHGYYVMPDDEKSVAGVTEYGIEFASALQQGNIFAVQFHPEKSHIAGLALFRNFMHWDGGC
ncbi:MAG: imidazole glycerol phosphate synthase subunit HisH [Pseudohongiellaceae bacterium]